MPDPKDLLSIGDLAEASGVAVGTIRAWEARYGVPAAVRLPSGHRRYRASQVRWLRRVAEAVARGHRPSRVVRLSERALDDLLDETGPEEGAGAPAGWLALARRYEGRRLARALKASSQQIGLVPFFDQRLGPFLESLGRAWADGEVSVRHEHWVSQVVEDFLRARRRALRRPRAPGTPVGVLATLSGERHVLGLWMAACAAASRGVRVRMLGADSPNAEIAAAVREGRAGFVGVSVSLASGGLETDRALGDLRGLLPASVRLLVGGRGARGARRPPRGVEVMSSIRELDDWLAKASA